MSHLVSQSNLSTPLKELVIGATQDGGSHLGKSEKDKSEVVEWIGKAANLQNAVDDAEIRKLDTVLTPRTYIVSNYLTAADVALYGALHPTVSQSKLASAQYYAHPSVTRYFDHIQSLPSVRKSADAQSPTFDLVLFDLDAAPKAERKAEPAKKKDKLASQPSEPPAANEKASSSAALTAQDARESAPSQGKDQKKEKTEKVKNTEKQKATGDNGKGASEESGEPSPSMIDLRVGLIVDVKKHPDADGLYVEQIDIGEDTGPRTVVSGLVNYVPIEQMRNKYLVAVCNLKPANMRGVKSHAMVLCATHKDGKEGGLEIVEPPKGSKPGDKVYFEGAKFENATPLSQMNPKKKIFETIQPGFTTLDTREAAWVNPATKEVHKIRTKDGVCVAPTFVGATLS